MPDSATFENYEILRRTDGSLWELGRGAMGVTYKATDINLQCDVALKIINTEILRSEEAIQRFYREARSAASLRHPNIAAVYHLGKSQDGSPYYAMEFCEGPTVQQLVESKGPLPLNQALEITLQVTKALVIAEQHHVVHRDLKPANLIVTQRGDEPMVVKVIDFGLAKMGGETSGWSSISGQGFIGTAHFSSPEQIEGRTVDTRSDIYSLGATLFFILTGKPLYEGSAARIISQHLSSEPPYHLLPPMPPGVTDLVKRMLAKEPPQRPASAIELRQQIDSLLNSPRAVPANKPPPLPSQSSAGSTYPGPPSTPPRMPSEIPLGPVTILDLMKVRGVLTPGEALQLAAPLAKTVDATPDGSLVLLKQAIRIRFNQSGAGKADREFLRIPVSEWPSFTLETERLSAAEMPTAPNPDLTIASVGTIVPGLNSSGGSIGALGTLIYEMVGGTPSRRYVPVARLSEAQNLVLQRAISSGSVMFTSAVEMLEKLSKDALDTRATPINIPQPPPTRPLDSSTGSTGGTMGVNTSRLQANSNQGSRSFFRTREGKQMAMAGAGVIGLLLVIGVVLLYSWLTSKPEGDKPKDPQVTQQTNTPTPPPGVDPNQVKNILPVNNGPNKTPSFDDLAKKFLNQNPNGNNNPPRTNNNPNPSGKVQFVVVDSLGQGQVSEDVYIYVNRAPIILSSGATNQPSLRVNQYNQQAKLTITVPGPGYYELGATATSYFAGGLSGNRACQGQGGTKIYISGGEVFRLASTFLPDGFHFSIQFEAE